MVRVGVLADVERRQVQAEGGDGTDHRGQLRRWRSAGRRCGPATRASARGRRSARRCPGSRGRARRGAPVASRARVFAQLRLHAAGLEPVRLLGVDPAEPLATARAACRGRSRATRTGRARPARSRRDTDTSSISSSRAFSAAWMPCSYWISSTSRVTFGGDVRVAVPVAADPRAEGQRPAVRRGLHAQVAQRLGEIGEHLRCRVGVQIAQVVDGVAGLVGRVGPVDAQLVGLPQQVDQLGEPAVGAGGGRRRARRRRPRRRARRRSTAAWTGSSGGPPRSGAR